MCWWVTVSAPLVYNLGVRLGNSLLDFLYHTLHCFTDVITETNDATQSEESDTEREPEKNPHHHVSEKIGHDTAVDQNETRDRRCNMAERPLPVPVENELYYMNIDRTEAENLLKGHPDGTFILRPSSQSNHVYTLSVSCSDAVHNVGVRRRQDGRLALGFSRRGERSFSSVPSLLRYHKRRRLLLVAAGGVLGATTLNETPHYYQTPSNIPLAKT